MQVILGVFSLFLLNGCGPLGARVEANKAYQAYQKKDFEGAVLHYEAALQKSPDNLVLLKNLGFTHLEMARTAADSTQTQKHYNQAIDVLFKALKIQPEDKELAGILVDAWSQVDRLSEASAYYREYTNRFPKDPEAWQVLGQIEIRRSNYEAALETYNKRQELLPNDLQITVGKAILCWEWLRAGNQTSQEKALEIANMGLEAALKVDSKDPNHPTALVYAGLLLRQRANHQKDSKASHQDLLEAQKLLLRVKARNKGA